MPISRFSSRHEPLGPVLADRLRDASRYLRIAGYFRSSLLEVVGEALESVGEIRVVPRDGDNVFVHGKAGLIEHPDGRTYSFVGSMNDSVAGLRHAYEILWADDDPAAAAWVREEFEHFRAQGVDLPDAVVNHVAAMANRIEYRSIEEARDPTGRIPPEAVLADRPPTRRDKFSGPGKSGLSRPTPVAHHLS